MWREPDCNVCLTVGYRTCQRGQWGHLQIVEEYHGDGSHLIHIVAPHFTYARLDSFQVMTTLDDATFADPFRDAVKVLLHLGFAWQDGIVSDDAALD